MRSQLLIFLSLLALVSAFDKFPKEFLFELPDNEEFCFYEVFNKEAAKEQYTVSFRVIRGGNNDVDFTVTGPNNRKVFQKLRQHSAEQRLIFERGVYSFCFSNKFSTITHKHIFFSLNRDRPETLAEEAGVTKVPTAMSLLQTKMEAIHEYLASVESVQSIYKARESAGRLISEELNDRVMTFSTILALAVLVCGFGQVAILRTFFSEAVPSKSVSHPRA